MSLATSNGETGVHPSKLAQMRQKEPERPVPEAPREGVGPRDAEALEALRKLRQPPRVLRLPAPDPHRGLPRDRRRVAGPDG